MERREALRYTALFLGAAVSGSTIAAWLGGCTVDDTPEWTPVFFTPDEVAFVRELGETMLPRTGTPGARDAMVDKWLDTIRPLRYPAEDNERFKAKLGEFMAEAEKDLGRPFPKADQDTRLAWLLNTDKEAFTWLDANPDAPVEERPFYLSLKEQLLAAYFNSEIVAKEYFAFDPIPGRYDPCIPFSEVGKAWAL
jgi:hypothetical protein